MAVAVVMAQQQPSDMNSNKSTEAQTFDSLTYRRGVTNNGDDDDGAEYRMELKLQLDVETQI